MLQLKFNKENVTREELNQIEKRLNHFIKETITPEFNVLNLSRTDVYAHVLRVFIRLNVHTILQVSISQLLDFLIDVAEKYTEAPYHTFYHAADIVTMLYYLCHDLNANKYLTDLDITFLMVAALCHDIGHPGFNNAFQTNTETELALLYGEKSTLETYSVDLTMELIQKHEINRFGDLMNTMVTELILSTDMANHNELEEQAKQLFTTWNKTKMSTTTTTTTTTAKTTTTTTTKKATTKATATTTPREKRIDSCINRMNLSKILLHAADISNMARPWIISKQWSDLIVKEFYNQGDEEKKRNMTISAGMDREVCSQKSISLKFGEIILPFFECLVSLLPKSHVLVDFLASNRIQWECLDHYKKRNIRRVSSDIIIQKSSSNTITFKRIRLGFRSQSYPTVLYHHHYSNHLSCNNNTIHNNNVNHTTLLPLVTFKSSLLYDNQNNLESITLYHPYDQ